MQSNVPFRQRVVLSVVCIGVLTGLFPQRKLFAQEADGAVRCRPAAERTGELGCWIMADESVGQLTQKQVFWYLDVYPTRSAAVAAKDSQGTVLDSLGKIWLLTIGESARQTPSGAQRIAKIGPIPITAGTTYSAQYMEAVFNPGMTSSVHDHSGPEAWYTMAGETCLETSEGVLVGRAGGPPVIVPEGLPMHLTATGTETRRALVLILHDSSKPPTHLVHEWVPKGLCKK